LGEGEGWKFVEGRGFALDKFFLVADVKFLSLRFPKLIKIKDWFSQLGFSEVS
jgi:hypothetical protein